jgi:hypothetical protein
MTLRKITLRTLAHPIAVRATQRFADTDLGVRGPPEDTQTGHHQKNKSGSHASPCPYRGCLCRHHGGLSSLLAALSVVHQDALFQFTHIVLRSWTFCPDSVAAANQDRRIKRQE